MIDLLRQGASSNMSDQQAFLLRTLLIHDYRRLLLRDPELPDALLPPHWPGQQARALCQELYRRLLAPSERHLDAVMRLADSSTPPCCPCCTSAFRAKTLCSSTSESSP